MKTRYDKSTDSMYVELRSLPARRTVEVEEDVMVDVGDDNKPVGYDIQHASHKADLIARLALAPIAEHQLILQKQILPKTKQILEVFVASPSDLVEERNLLEEVVAEYNITSRDIRDIRLELVKWETHTHPSFGTDAQDVINKQIGFSYDIFIGIMWGRFGSPTGRASSGTEEEFERAYKRFKETKGAVQLMFYFKDAPIPPSKIDTEQLARVQSFKEKIKSDYGALIREFQAPEEFQKSLRIHLNSVVQDCLRAASDYSVSENIKIAQVDQPPASSALLNLTSLSDEDEEGIFDLSEAVQDSLQKTTEIVNHINLSISELGAKIGERVAEINGLKEQGLLPDNKLAKKISNAIAEDTELFVRRMSADIPMLTSEYAIAMDKFGRMAMLSGSDFNEPIADIQNALTTLIGMRHSMSGTHGIIIGLRDAIIGTPRMTTAYNRARKRAAAVVEDFLAFLETASRQSSEVEEVIQKVLDQRTSALIEDAE